MSTGARRFERSVLCTPRKLTSLAFRMLRETLVSAEAIDQTWKLAYLSRTRTWMGTAATNPTNFLLDATRTATCQSLWNPGGIRALCAGMNANACCFGRTRTIEGTRPSTGSGMTRRRPRRNSRIEARTVRVAAQLLVRRKSRMTAHVLGCRP